MPAFLANRRIQAVGAVGDTYAACGSIPIVAAVALSAECCIPAAAAIGKARATCSAIPIQARVAHFAGGRILAFGAIHQAGIACSPIPEVADAAPMTEFANQTFRKLVHFILECSLYSQQQRKDKEKKNSK